MKRIELREVSWQGQLDSVRVRRSGRCPQNLDSSPLGNRIEATAELGIVVANRETRAFSPRRRLAELLGHPSARRRAGHSDVNNSSRFEFDQEEREDRSEEKVVGLQEVAGPGFVGMIAQERRPALAGWSRSSNSAHVLLDRALRHADVELQQFAANPLGSPETIAPGHPFDEGDRLGGYPRRRAARLRSPSPESSKPPTMPAEDGLGLDEQRRTTPGRNETGEQDEDGSIRSGQSRPCDLSARDFQLLPAAERSRGPSCPEIGTGRGRTR